MRLGKALYLAFKDISNPRKLCNVPAATISDIFKRDIFLFRSVPQIQPDIMQIFRQEHRVADKTGPARFRLLDPADNIPGAGFDKDRKDKLAASPALMYTEYPFKDNRTGFAAVMRDHIEHHTQAPVGSARFGLSGTFNTDGSFSVEKIMLPGHFIGACFNKNRLHEIPVTDQSVKGALHYAQLCADQIFDRRIFTPEHNFEKSVHMLPVRNGLPVVTPPGL